MIKYSWTGENPQGKRLSGFILAESQQMLSFYLNVHRIIPLSIKKRKLSLPEQWYVKVSHQEFSQFLFQLASLLRAGVPLQESLLVQFNPKKVGELQIIILKTLSSLEHGLPLSKALHRSGLHLDALTKGLIATGEHTGHLDQGIFLAHNYLVHRDKLKQQVRRATYYPATVIIIAFISCYLLLTLVLPKFERLFASFDAPLPSFTQTVISISHYLLDYGPVMLLGLGLSSLLTTYAYQTQLTFRYHCDALLLKLPILGPLAHTSATARFTRCLAITQQSGLGILRALSLALPLLNNAFLEKQASQVATRVQIGSSLYQAFSEVPWASQALRQMIKVGEESGQLATMLLHLCREQETDVQLKTDALLKLIEPLLILFLTITVGSLVVAMYLPIFNLMSLLN